MRLPEFEYYEPATIKEACAMLSQPETKLLAGGTELLVSLKQRTVTPQAVINIKRIPRLDYIEFKEDRGLSLGPLAVLSAVAASPLVRARYGLLAQAAERVGKPQIPNAATLGGNLCLESRCHYYNQSYLWKQSRPACYKDGGKLCHMVKGSDHCHALFVADTVPALIALGAEVTISDEKGKQQVPLEKFYTGKGEKVNLLQPRQILTRIQVPVLPPRNGGVYLKHSLREAIDFAIVGVAVVITVGSGEVCRDARIVLGSVASGPVKAVEAEAAVKGQKLDDKLMETAARLTLKAVHPITHLGFSAAYKRQLVKNLTLRALKEALRKAKAG